MVEVGIDELNAVNSLAVCLIPRLSDIFMCPPCIITNLCLGVLLQRVLGGFGRYRTNVHLNQRPWKGHIIQPLGIGAAPEVQWGHCVQGFYTKSVVGRITASTLVYILTLGAGEHFSLHAKRNFAGIIKLRSLINEEIILGHPSEPDTVM